MYSPPFPAIDHWVKHSVAAPFQNRAKNDLRRINQRVAHRGLLVSAQLGQRTVQHLPVEAPKRLPYLQLWIVTLANRRLAAVVQPCNCVTQNGLLLRLEQVKLAAPDQVIQLRPFARAFNRRTPLRINLLVLSLLFLTCVRLWQVKTCGFGISRTAISAGLGAGQNGAQS